ncbi:hypothetical protein MSR1_20570 [Magnetospirillum gryphiswaldense MSR-1]|nr:hypothetical protein MSR1_20570 [Magnetospirillum gryphiswaldense MSR-1]AVM78448.1 hypothetical protein MSR1L_20570 [Magnetospirillum gryphiswaldense]
MLAFTSSDFIGRGIVPNDIFLNSKSALNLTELELKVKLRAAATEPTQSLGSCQSSRQVTNVFATYGTQEPFASTQGHVAAQKATGVAIMEPPVSPRRETQARCPGSDCVATQGTFGATDEGADASQSNCRTTGVSATQTSGDAIIEDADASTSTGLKAEVEARLRWARKGWKWGMAQFWRNTGRKTVKGVRIPPSLKFSLGREQMAHEAVYFADMLPLTKLAEVIERLRDETRLWYRGLYNGLVDLSMARTRRTSCSAFSAPPTREGPKGRMCREASPCSTLPRPSFRCSWMGWNWSCPCGPSLHASRMPLTGRGFGTVSGKMATASEGGYSDSTSMTVMTAGRASGNTSVLASIQRSRRPCCSNSMRSNGPGSSSTQ